MILQRTLREPISIEGIGVHTGKQIQLILRPAPVNHGIVFQRVDLSPPCQIEAHYGNIVSTEMATTLGFAKVTLSTVEHLLAAFFGMGIDNAWVEVNGPELPILDGSALPFSEAIRQAGTKAQFQVKPYLHLKKRIEVKSGDKWAILEPCSRLEVHGSVDWNHPAIGYQEFKYVDGVTPFEELCSARTFGFLEQVDSLKKKGLALGGSLDNAVVLDCEKVLNPEGLRFADEFVRHKVLDFLGDLMLAGVDLRASVRMHRAGHEFHRLMLSQIFKDPSQFEIIKGSEQRARMVEPTPAPGHLETALTPGYSVGY